MRKLDYLRLGRISLKANRKTTIQTVIGISFGLVLLFPLLFLIIGFYGGFDAELNNETSYRTHRIMYSSEVTHQGKVLCLEKYEKDISYNITCFSITYRIRAGILSWRRHQLEDRTGEQGQKTIQLERRGA